MKNYIYPYSLRALLLFLAIAALACAPIGRQIQQELETRFSWVKEDESEPMPTTGSAVLPEITDIVLAGEVKDAMTGKPLPAMIYLLDEQLSEQLEDIVANDNGYFTITVPKQLGRMRIELPGYQVQEIDLNSWGSSPTNELEIDLVPDKLIGVVLAADTNEPLAGVSLVAVSDSYSQTATTKLDGAFELYRLTTNSSISVLPPEGYLPLDVTFSTQKILTFTLNPRQLSVTLQDRFNKTPLPGIDLIFNETFTATTDLEGHISFSRVPASGQISVAQPGYLPATIAYEGDEAIIIDLVPMGLQGLVRDRDTGEPVPRAALYLGETILRADDNGHFMIEALPMRPEQIMIKAAGYHRTYARLAQTGVFTDFTAPFSGVEGRWLSTTPCAGEPPRPEWPCLDLWLEPFQVKAIYIPFHYLGSRDLMLGYLDFVASTELNAIVVDVKGDFGFIGWQSNVKLVEDIGADEWRKDYWLPLDELVVEAKKRNVYTIARIVIFKDDPLAHGKPEWAAVRADGSVWLDGEDLGWANPFREEVWAYNIALAEEVAAFGVDEINFDYIRFPSDGDIGAIVYQEENSRETRTAAIREFMQRLTAALQPYGVFTSADVFGLTVWVEPESDMSIGQRLIDIAPHIDYLAPMIYPSTFIAGNLGYDNPSAEPYNVIFRSQNEAETRVPPYVKVRPWLQAYWYSLEEMQLQKQAANEAESVGWSWWNAGGKYDEALFEAVSEER